MVAAGQLSEHFLYPSTLYASDQPTRVQTILGSCVAVCLHDPVLNIGGINHFMLPSWTGNGLQSPKYGDIAIGKLIEKIIQYGGRRETLVAKIFGGAEQHESGAGSYRVGQRNIALAEQLLELERIPIVAKSLGGELGRKLIYYTHTNEVLIKYLHGMAHEKN